MVEPIRDSLADYITSDEACAILGRAPKTLAIWRWKGIGPAFIKVGVAVLYRRADVLDFKAQRDAGATMSQIGGAR